MIKRCNCDITPENTSETTAISFRSILREGPEVSLKGSPTVSPITVALCTSEPFPPRLPSSTHFLALSHAPPAFASIMARGTPDTRLPARNPPNGIDHSFQVKGVGTVALAVVLSGTVEKYQKLTVNPGGQIVQVKSLQVHDVDVDSAVAGLRVGLCIKDAKPEDLPRGIILSADELPTTDYLKAELHLTKYHKKNLFAGEHYMLNTHLNYVPCIIVAGDCVPGKNCDVEIQLEKPFVESDANMLLMNPGGTIPRVFASVKL